MHQRGATMTAEEDEDEEEAEREMCKVSNLRVEMRE